MFGSNNTIVTLNIESDSARLLTVKGNTVESWKAVPLTSDSIKDTAIANVSAVAAALDDLFKAARASKNEVIVSLTGLGSIYRTVTLPKLKNSKVKEAIRWVAMREIPIDLENVHLFWQALGKADEERLVFLVATPIHILQTIQEALAKAKIKPKMMDLKPFALARFVNQRSALIVDMEEDNNSIVIIRDGTPQVMHTVIVQHKDQSFGDRVQRLANDLNRTVLFYNNAHEGNPITPSIQAFVTGKLADNPDIIKLVTDSVAYTFGSPPSCLAYTTALPVCEYAVNMGLALKEQALFKQSKDPRHCPVNINMLPSIN
jgi:hypothetical protein